MELFAGMSYRHNSVPGTPAAAIGIGIGIGIGHGDGNGGG